ncbi:MAG: hypothetical protein WBW08_00390 [Methyloceanibacter sp.]
MSAIRIALAIAGTGLIMAACASPRQSFERVVYGDPAKPYLGKTKAEIIACAGPPAGSFLRDSGETLTYHYSGPGPVPGAAPPKKEAKEAKDADAKPGIFGGKKQDKSWKCVASLTFENDRLTHVTFAPHDVISIYAEKKDAKTGVKSPAPQPEPCTFVLPNCAGGQ